MSVDRRLDAAQYDVAVVGGGVAGLAAAAECLRIGLRVVVLEAAEQVGGSVSPLELAGVAFDAGAESFATRGGAVERALAALTLDGRPLVESVVEPRTHGSWLHLSGGRSVPSPGAGVLGIPGTPLAPDVVRAIGRRGAWRAWLDTLMPVLRIGRAHSLAELVRTRMGRRVLEDLVAPVVSGVYSSRPEDIDVDLAAPGLNGAITRAGSLAGGVAALRANLPAGVAVRGIEGGMHRLVAALVERIDYLSGEIRTGVPVARLEGSDGHFVLTLDHGALTARSVIVATPENDARALLSGVVPSVGESPDSALHDSVELVTLVVDDPRLDAAPRGSGVLVAPTAREVTAKALTHATAKWEWLAASLPPGRHVLRLSYGRPGESPPLEGRGDDEVAEIALRDASLLLGTALDAASLVGSARVRWANVRPAAALGRRANLEAFREALAPVEGVVVTGTWMAGTGLASVLPHAAEAAALIRRRLVRQGVGLPREDSDGDGYS
ncbi:protoporphyrinogen/coproporphyrinogen oxidase [Rathayibacter tanaceti]|uniref:Oxygen-dependent protoporphyrinogen oxidase n=2 Tax=Rathayibacter tanaceti TaxID=1671680 RepID=A0ACD2XIN7_9MICO|nr:FAD-dependent oxidoreductase [Rathayibacter tanaceti]KZX21907.1 Protoporphyrinogen oxidase [Rathayibacter tanaceti]TCO36646.1 oxygen-dependent protoporphyrinogen oxidase [Rathayibacter tanaceti]